MKKTTIKIEIELDDETVNNVLSCPSLLISQNANCALVSLRNRNLLLLRWRLREQPLQLFHQTSQCYLSLLFRGLVAELDNILREFIFAQN